MTKIAIKDQIKRLAELQKIDREIYDLKGDSQTKPAQVEELKKQFEAKKATLHSLEEKFKGIQLDRKQKETDLKSKEAEILKANAQLNDVKTNKEYSAKLSEIEHIKADQSVIEEKILISYDEGDKATAAIEAEKKNVAQEEKSYLAEKKKVEDELKVIEDRIKVLDGQRKQIIPEVERVVLERYEKVLANKQGLAIVPIEKNSCGGCHIGITQQMINALKLHEDFIMCEMCQRILYLPDDIA